MFTDVGGAEQTFVDHHAGIVDARTGHRVRSDSNGHIADEEDNDAFRGGYGFFDAVSLLLSPLSALESEEY